MLVVASINELAQSKAQQQRLWDDFKRTGTTHSAMACLLPYIMRRCEIEKVPYKLIAHPGLGYFIQYDEEADKRIKEIDQRFNQSKL